MQYTSVKLKCNRSSTDWNVEQDKVEALDRVLSYINEHDEFNPGSVYVFKYINQQYIEHILELGILEQPNTTRFTEKLLHAFSNLCFKIINNKSVVSFFDTVSTVVKDHVESPDDFFIALLRFVLPIENELFKQEKPLSDELNLKCQKEPIPKELLFLTYRWVQL